MAPRWRASRSSRGYAPYMPPDPWRNAWYALPKQYFRVPTSIIPAYRLWILWIWRIRFLQFERPYNPSLEARTDCELCFLLHSDHRELVWEDTLRFSPIARMHNLRRLSISIGFETTRWIFTWDDQDFWLNKLLQEDWADQEFLDSYLRSILRWIPKYVHLSRGPRMVQSTSSK